jgi:threonyl-tRNA synthetase
MIKITLPGGRVAEAESGTPVGKVLNNPAALAAMVDGKPADLSAPLKADAVVAPLLFSDERGREVFWHSASHLMAQAVKELNPQAILTIGPAVEDGFYYDIDSPVPITEEDLPKIEAKMQEIVGRNIPVTRKEMSKSEAIEFFKARGDSYKVEILGEIIDGSVSMYEQGGFIDLCRGPHVASTGVIKAFKLTSIAGAYWRGDERNKMLTRLYGTAFPSQAELDAWLKMLEESKKRDHRRLGKDLDLFSFHDDGGPGLAYWHPKGAIIRRAIEDYWRDAHEKAGYDLVFSPHIGKAKLWETSGHLGFYKDSMYSPVDIEGQKYYLKPMNCPFHILMYQTRQRSYRDLPMRYCELGTVYRYERSGTLHGLMRVRGFTQDDAHLFVTPEQITGEVLKVVDFVLNIFKTFGFGEFSVFLSTRPENSVGTDELWEVSTNALRAALEKSGLPFGVDEGGGVFYGPKIDIKIKDSIGRLWQCSTIQVDFNLPERFDVTYAGEDGAQKRTVMIHRALFGSLERFFGILIEHYAGNFPLWLAPVQARVLTITAELEPYAKQVLEKLSAAGLRAEADLSNDKIANKIRKAETEKVPYMLVLGKREAEAGKVALRKHGKGDQGAILLEDFIAQATAEARERRLH